MELLLKPIQPVKNFLVKKNYESYRDKYKVKPIVLHLGPDLELWGLKRDGSIFPLEINLNPTRIEGKLFVIAFVTDTTSQKKTAKKLKVSQAQLKTYSEELEEKVITRTDELTTTVQKLVASNLSLEDQIDETKEAEKRAISSKSLSSAIAKNFPNGFIIVFNSNFEMLLLEGEAILKLGLDNMVFEDANVDDIPVFSKKQKSKLKQDVLKTIAGEHLRFQIKFRNLYFSVNTIPLLGDNTVISSGLFVYTDITAQKKIEREDKNALKRSW